MFGFEGVVISKSLYEAIPSLANLGLLMGNHLTNLDADDDVFRMIIISGIIVFFCKNSNHIRNSFKMNWATLIFSGLLFIVSVLNLNKVSPFLYFNF